MSTEILGTATVMRHGATYYTDVLPDLASEGLPLLRKNAAKVVEESNGKSPVFVCSPAARAKGTALELMRAFGLKPQLDAIQIMPLLRAIDMYDKAACIAHVKRVTGHLNDVLEIHRVWDRFYFAHLDFQIGIICESLDVTQYRFVQFVRNPLLRLCVTNPGRHIVVVTHIELLGAFLHDYFDLSDGLLAPSESAHFTLLKEKGVLVRFRDQEKLITKETLFPFTSV